MAERRMSAQAEVLYRCVLEALFGSRQFEAMNLWPQISFGATGAIN
jgi:hypothetical protein